MTARCSVAIRQVREDGSEAPVDGELAAALAGPAEQFAGLLAWAADEAGFLDHGEREEVIGEEGRELQRRLLEATFTIDAGCEERTGQVTSAAGVRSHCSSAASLRAPTRVRPSPSTSPASSDSIRSRRGLPAGPAPTTTTSHCETGPLNTPP